MWWITIRSTCFVFCIGQTSSCPFSVLVVSMARSCSGKLVARRLHNKAIRTYNKRKLKYKIWKKKSTTTSVVADHDDDGSSSKQQQQQQQRQPPKIIERMIGGFNLLIFVLVWLLSAISPFLLVYSIIYKHCWISTIIIIITRIAYHSPQIVLPKSTFNDDGNKNTKSCSRLRKFFGYYTPRYFQSVRIIWEDETIIKDNNNNKTNILWCPPAWCILYGLVEIIFK